MNSHTQRGADNPGLGGVVESIPFSERRIYVVHSMWRKTLWAQLLLTTPLLEQTSHPSTRNVVGTTHREMVTVIK